MYWILLIFGPLLRFVVNRKGWLWGTALIICGIGIYFALRPREVTYPENPLSPDYQRNMRYIIGAMLQAHPDLPKGWGSLLGSHLPIVDERDFPMLTKKLRYEFRKAANDDFSLHMFVLGGMDVRDIDQPLLKASKGLRMSGRSNIELIIVAPSTISNETKLILEKRGIKTRKIDKQSHNRPIKGIVKASVSGLLVELFDKARIKGLKKCRALSM